MDKTLGWALSWFAAGSYSTFLVAHWAGSRLPTMTSLVSELEAARQPHSLFFRLSDVFSGISIVAVAVLLVRCMPRDNRASAGCALLAVLGVGSITDGATRVTCAPSVDAACRAREDSVHGLIDQLSQWHTVSGLISFLAATGAMVLLGRAARATSPVFAAFSVGCAIAVAGIGLLDIPLIIEHSIVGVAERGRVLIIALWLGAVGVEFLRYRSAPRRHRPGPASARLAHLGDPA